MWGRGGRNGGNTQNDGIGSREEGRGGGNGGTQLRKEGVTEREKGNLVIPNPPCDEREKLTICLEPPNQSEGADGKGENILTLATSSHHGMEKELMVMDEMVWQNGQEEEKLAGSWAVKSHLSKMGLGEPKSPTSPTSHGEVGQIHVAEANNYTNTGRNKGAGLTQSTWKRKNREGENMKETQDHQITSNLGKRGERLEGVRASTKIT